MPRRIVFTLPLVMLAAWGLWRMTISRPSSQVVVFYDRSWEFDGKLHSSLVQGIVAKNKDFLSQPVAIADTKQDSYTWNILYATNRAPTATPQGVAYHAQQATKIQHGVATVRVPRVSTLAPIGGSKLSIKSPDPTKLVSVTSLEPDGPSDFQSHLNKQLAASPQRDLLVFIHGFNVSLDAALQRTAQIAQDMPFNGAVVCYSWPSHANTQSYRADQRSADASVELLAQFLFDLAKHAAPDVKINLLAHSMGNRVLMQALNRLPNRTHFREVVLAAPDVGVKRFQELFPGVKQVAERVTLYASDGDLALLASLIANLERRAGDSENPVLLSGLDTIDVSRVDVGFMGHSFYGSNRSVLRDLFGVLKMHAPIEERRWLQKSVTAGPWVFDCEVGLQIVAQAQDEVAR